MNQYHIYEGIGRGKHSVVYKGRKKKTIQYYAIKSVEKTQKARVLQEVRTMHALDHNNILKFYAWYETSNHLWLILEYCVGGDLMSLLRQDMRLPEASIHDFARDLVVSLQYLHANSIVYCDLKPSNILLDENGRIKLGGFGLSRRLSDINKTSLQSLPQAKRGTPCYMAPELFQDGSTHSSASDLWALGCVLYECAAGHPPFVSTSFNQLVNDILNAEPAPLPGASAEFTDLVMRLVDKNAASRMTWQEMRTHPFWQCSFPVLPIPAEPMLEAFIQANGLAASAQMPQAMGMPSVRQSQGVRDSTVNVLRLSCIVRSNLEKESDGADYHAASTAKAPLNDVQLNHPDAELDFEEQAAEDASEDEESTSPSNLDEATDGNMEEERPSAAAEADRLDMDRKAMRMSTAGTPNRAPPDPSLAEPSSRSPEPIPPPALGDEEQAAPTPARMGPVSNGNAAGMSPRSDEPQAAHPSVPTVEELIWHASDSSVKPIVSNRRIERVPEARWEARLLPFTPLTLQEMLSAPQVELENFLTHIYRTIAGAAPLKDKVNVLAYFETLCVDTGAANVLINSSLTILVVRMLRNARAPTLRIRLASVVGLLVRHATYIADELAATGVVEVLAEALRDKNERVRRRVMASLGELLFYVATQQQDSGAESLWQVPPSTITLVTRLLKSGEDEIAQHYAIKTIENIASQGGAWAARFASQDVIYNLVQIYHGKSEALKPTAASTLSRLLRHNPALLSYVVDKFGIRLFVTGLADSSAKVQCAAVNMLSLALSLPEFSVRARSALQEERGLVGSLCALLEAALPVLRAKGLLAITLLTRTSPRWLLDACKAKLVPQVERLHREKDTYIGYAIEALRAEISVTVPAIMQQVGSEMERGRRPASGGTPGRGTAKDPLALFPLVLHLVTSPALRSAAISENFIADLADLLRASSAASSAYGTSLQEFKAVLLHTLEAVCQQGELIVAHHNAVLSHLLPALAATTAAGGESGDTRFLCLKLLCDVTLHFLMEPDLYSSEDGAGSATAAIDAVVGRHVLPLVPALLSEEDPMPLYALKLLGALLDTKQSWVAHVERLGLVPRFFEFLSLEHSNNNVHNIRLCRLVVAAASLTPAAMRDLDVFAKVSAVLAYAHENAVEPFLEPVLELCAALLDSDRASLAQGVPGAGESAALVGMLPIFLSLAAHPDANVAAAAAQCTALLPAMFPASAALLLAGSGITALCTALQPDSSSGTNPVVQHHLLAALTAACRSGQPVPVSPGDMKRLQKMVSTVANGDGNGLAIVEMASEAASALGSLSGSQLQGVTDRIGYMTMQDSRR
ncbi:hypothetical protein WJX72_003108 [[Myrmecia] bisecta]|uniref:Protein kinase domain-containing protein n=1 Tax=[Myrmecia] bisecta TaxID=41462 RepID=A0AAW1PPS2_9CHLO